MPPALPPPATPLEQRLKELIATEGPLPLSTFMQLALHDPADGYYATRPGPGRDFATAPETSQIFGELIGLWVVHEWRAIGSPSPFTLAEIGPGRGTLMDDALRIAAIAGGEAFDAARELVLVEPSPAMRAAQRAHLARQRPVFIHELSELPSGPALILANEFLDCLPARQFRQTSRGWRECVVGLGPDGGLVFGLAADAPPCPGDTEFVGEVVEVQPGLDLLIAELAARAAPWRALFVDYGTVEQPPGDTLRAFRAGRQVPALDRPGESDLTVDVDFGRLARLARSAGLDVAGPVPQGLFLMNLGAQARLDQLVKANPGEAEVIYRRAAALIDPKQMGERFKAICLSPQGLPQPAGF